MTKEMLEQRLEELFDELVPANGKAATVAGEIVRAMNKIAYRSFNDGDHVGVGYGKETCNPAARYLMARAGAEVKTAVGNLWGISRDDIYDAALMALEAAVIGYIDQHPELKAIPNCEDMWDFRDKDEDVDDSWQDGEDDEEGWY